MALDLLIEQFGIGAVSPEPFIEDFPRHLGRRGTLASQERLQSSSQSLCHCLRSSAIGRRYDGTKRGSAVPIPSHFG
jgi:hypothetical protein